MRLERDLRKLWLRYKKTRRARRLPFSTCFRFTRCRRSPRNYSHTRKWRSLGFLLERQRPLKAVERLLLENVCWYGSPPKLASGHDKCTLCTSRLLYIFSHARYLYTARGPGKRLHSLGPVGLEAEVLQPTTNDDLEKLNRT